MPADLLNGEILEEYRSVVEAAVEEKYPQKRHEEKETHQTEGNPCSEVLTCSQGCTGSTTDERTKQKKAQLGAWFDPPVA